MMFLDWGGHDLGKIRPSAVWKAASWGGQYPKAIAKEAVENPAAIVAIAILVINPIIVLISGDIIRLPDVGKSCTERIPELAVKIMPSNLSSIKKNPMVLVRAYKLF